MAHLVKECDEGSVANERGLVGLRGREVGDHRCDGVVARAIWSCITVDKCPDGCVREFGVLGAYERSNFVVASLRDGSPRGYKSRYK